MTERQHFYHTPMRSMPWQRKEPVAKLLLCTESVIARVAMRPVAIRTPEERKRIPTKKDRQRRSFFSE